MATAQDYVNDFRAMRKNVSESRALLWLNEIDLLVQRVLRTRRTTALIALVAGQQDYDLDESYVWVISSRILTGPADSPNPTPGRVLVSTSDDTADVLRPDHVFDGAGDPEAFASVHDASGGQIRLYPAPARNSLLVSGATNASPIVVTAAEDHGLSEGQKVEIRGVLGNTAANGVAYAKVSGYTDDEFALYSDSELTTPVAGSGAYTSGGIVIAVNREVLEVVASYHPELVLSPSASDMPASPTLRSLYLDGMDYLYAKRRQLPDVAARKALFEDSLNEQSIITHKRGGRVNQHLNILHVRPGGYVSLKGTGW